MNPARLPRTAFALLLTVGALSEVTAPASAAKRVLRLRLDGPMPEAPLSELDLHALLGDEHPKVFHDWIRLVQKATQDATIEGLVVIIEEPELGLGQIEEFVAAVQAFREKGKKVYTYLDHATNASYLLACAADHITLSRHSAVELLGLRAELFFFKGLLDQLGIQADLLRVGEYKTAVEPFTRTEPTPQSAEQINRLLDGLHERFLATIMTARGLTRQEAQAAIDTSPLTSQQALDRKLVDTLGSFPEFKQRIRKAFGQDVEIVKRFEPKRWPTLDLQTPFHWMQLFNELMEEAAIPRKPGIALIPIEGILVLGESEPGMGENSLAGSTTLRAAFEQAREDEQVKAVVARVNSPGGSALASEILWSAASRCAQEKPLIVSMGNVAASGGYYVAVAGDTVYADEATITGSVGVFGGKLLWRDLFEDKLRITTALFLRGANAALWSPNQPWTQEQRELVQRRLETVYEQFTHRVIESRGNRIEGKPKTWAAGRVYTGKQALQRGLVDKIGGLADAIQDAATRAGLTDYELLILPEPKSLSDWIEEALGQKEEDEFSIRLPNDWFSSKLIRALPASWRNVLRPGSAKFRSLLAFINILGRDHVLSLFPVHLRLD